MTEVVTDQITENLCITKYTFEDLSKLTVAELIKIKKQKQQELYEVQKEKAVLCANIISLQNMIITECKSQFIQNNKPPQAPIPPETRIIKDEK